MSESDKHIALYTDDPEFGGVAHYNHNILLALRQQGYRVTCIQGHSQSPLVQQQRAAGIVHEWIPYDTKNQFTRTITDAETADAILKRVNPDLLYFSDCCPVSNIAGKHVATHRGLPFINVVHYVAPYLADRFAQCLPVMAKQHAAAQVLIAVSRENLDQLENRFGTPRGKGIVIYNGRPKAFFEPPSPTTRARLRAEMRVPAQATACFSAARMSAVKGFQYIAAAAAVLKSSPAWKNLYFVWAGDGEERAALEQQLASYGVKDHFRLLGHRWDTCELYTAADIFALPSQSEGMPLTVMEAMARRVPVIATAVSGIPEELGDTGCLIPDPARGLEGTIRGLVDGLVKWSSNASARSKAAEAGYARADRFFHEEQMLQRVTGVVRETLAAVAEKRLPQVAPFDVPRPGSVSEQAKAPALAV